jgi:hypothetical protein
MQEGLEALFPDLIALLCSQLSVRDIVNLSAVSKTLNRRINGNNAIWTTLCVRLLGKKAPQTKKELTVSIGLAEQHLSWKSFFTRTWGSTVLTWGDASGGRTGHMSAEDGEEGAGEFYEAIHIRVPTILASLSGKGIDFVGKTAEVGSVAIAFGGQRVYFWGEHARSRVPVMIPAELLCGNAADRVVDASCHHDSGFMLVFASGLTLVAKRFLRRSISCDDFHDFSRDVFGGLLLPGERAVCSLGSQANAAGVRTTRGRVLWWHCNRVAHLPKRPVYRAVPGTYGGPAAADELEELMVRLAVSEDEEEEPAATEQPRIPCFELEPKDELGRPIEVAKTAFGHRYWFAITSSGLLYWFRPSAPYEDEHQKSWTRVPGTETLEDDPIVCVDSGSEHHALCTLSGRAYTWGCTRFGMLGLGELDRVDEIATPTLVESLSGVVAVGAGGYRSWQGSFTLFLLGNNDLYYAGRLGDLTNCPTVPRKIDCPGLRGRHILSISCGEDWAAVVASST